MFDKAITVNPDPTLRRLSFKLRRMNMIHFNDELTIQEPGDGSLFWGNDFISGYRERLGDKISAQTLLDNEDIMIEEIVKRLKPWYLKIKAEEALRSLPKHNRRELYVIRGVVRTMELGMLCDGRCVCPGLEKLEALQKEVSSNERRIKGDTSGQVPVP